MTKTVTKHSNSSEYLVFLSLIKLRSHPYIIIEFDIVWCDKVGTHGNTCERNFSLELQRLVTG